MSLVSVVIPAYEPGGFLTAALESVHLQTLTDWEVVVVDDGSQQDVQAETNGFDRVRVIRQANAGASVARNRGVLASSGTFVAFMDQDDLWAPSKLEHQLRALEDRPDAGLCYCDLQVFSEGSVQGSDEPRKDNEAPPSRVVLDPANQDDLAHALAASLEHFGQAFVVPSTVMFRRDVLADTGLLDPWMPFTGDFDLLIRAGAARPSVHLEWVGTYYRKHDSNFSDDYDRGRRELRVMRDRYVTRASSLGDRQLAEVAQRVLRRPRRLYAAQAFDVARRAWRCGDRAGTAHHLLRSATFDPRILAESVTHRLHLGNHEESTD